MKDQRAIKREHDSIFIFKYNGHASREQKGTHVTYMREYGVVETEP